MWIKNSNEQLNRSKYSDVIKSKDHTEKEKKELECKISQFTFCTLNSW